MIVGELVPGVLSGIDRPMLDRDRCEYGASEFARLSHGERGDTAD